MVRLQQQHYGKQAIRAHLVSSLFSANKNHP